MPRSAPRAIEWAAEQLAAGGVIAIPTDTVYGIAASLSHAGAIQRIFRVKGRSADRPLPVLVSSSDAVLKLADEIDEHVAFLLDRFWPGPLTVVVPARPGVPAGVKSHDDMVGVRLPNHRVAVEIIEKAGGAIACTSANSTGEPPAITAQQVAATIGGALDLIIDGGRAPGGVPSTVVAVVKNGIEVLREGAIPAMAIQSAWDEIQAAHG
jgi:L-threonylcarbamoyladenylate synthase